MHKLLTKTQKLLASCPASLKGTTDESAFVAYIEKATKEHDDAVKNFHEVVKEHVRTATATATGTTDANANANANAKH